MGSSIWPALYLLPLKRWRPLSSQPQCFLSGPGGVQPAPHISQLAAPNQTVLGRSREPAHLAPGPLQPPPLTRPTAPPPHCSGQPPQPPSSPCSASSGSAWLPPAWANSSLTVGKVWRETELYSLKHSEERTFTPVTLGDSPSASLPVCLHGIIFRTGSFMAPAAGLHPPPVFVSALRPPPLSSEHTAPPASPPAHCPLLCGGSPAVQTPGDSAYFRLSGERSLRSQHGQQGHVVLQVL